MSPEVIVPVVVRLSSSKETSLSAEVNMSVLAELIVLVAAVHLKGPETIDVSAEILAGVVNPPVALAIPSRYRVFQRVPTRPIS